MIHAAGRFAHAAQPPPLRRLVPDAPSIGGLKRILPRQRFDDMAGSGRTNRARIVAIPFSLFNTPRFRQGLARNLIDGVIDAYQFTGLSLIGHD